MCRFKFPTEETVEFTWCPHDGNGVICTGSCCSCTCCEFYFILWILKMEAFFPRIPRSITSKTERLSRREAVLPPWMANHTHCTYFIKKIHLATQVKFVGFSKDLCIDACLVLHLYKVSIVYTVFIWQMSPCKLLNHGLVLIFFFIYNKKFQEEEEEKIVQSLFTVKLIKYDEKQKVPLIKEIKALVEGMNLVQVRK